MPAGACTVNATVGIWPGPPLVTDWIVMNGSMRAASSSGTRWRATTGSTPEVAPWHSEQSSVAWIWPMWRSCQAAVGGAKTI